jgi:nucleotide-binding universal stress UspA family protein
MYKHLLVPTDGSPLSRRAVKTAVALAGKLGARITFLHVIPPFMPPAYVDFMVPVPELYSPDEYKRATSRHARQMLARGEALAKQAGVRADGVYEEGALAWETIIEVARRRRCDAIVMASHGRRGISGFLLGSETQHVLTRSKIPVLVTR